VFQAIFLVKDFSDVLFETRHKPPMVQQPPTHGKLSTDQS
jgi:hypothetical protein